MLDHSQNDAPATPERRFVNDLLDEWDFIGVGDLLPYNQDEYTCLVTPLLQRLTAGQGPAELTAFLNHALEDHFGLGGPEHGTAQFARRLHSAWAQRTA